ncbi:hypothetical protein LCGC14_2789220 [marine sediment metagenome]|uniref:Uncharacterized protein n=1 Tax=marine sediment metagenome TaxID=412755 RepID=A0A0F8YR45_9ZZZZ
MKFSDALDRIAALRHENRRLYAENKRLEALDKDWLRASEQWVTENERLENRLNLAFEMLNDHGVDNAAIMKHIKSLMERVSTEPKRDLFEEIKEGLEAVRDSQNGNKADVSPKTAIEKDGINDRGSDEYANPERDGDRQ